MRSNVIICQTEELHKEKKKSLLMGLSDLINFHVYKQTFHAYNTVIQTLETAFINTI